MLVLKVNMIRDTKRRRDFPVYILRTPYLYGKCYYYYYM